MSDSFVLGGPIQPVSVVNGVTLDMSTPIDVTVTSMPEVVIDDTTPVSVTVSGTPNVAVTNTPSVSVTNTPSVTISGTPNVSVTNTPNVAVTNTPTVNIGTIPSPFNVTVANTPAVDVQFNAATQDTLGRLNVAEPAIIFESSSRYGIDRLWGKYTSGTGNVNTHNGGTGSWDLTLGTTAAGYACLQTYTYHQYQPFKVQEVVITGVLKDGAGNRGRREVGYGDCMDGLFFEIDTNGDIQLLRRNSSTGAVGGTVGPSGTKEYRVPYAQWNGDGSGLDPRVANIDWTKNQIFIIRFVWLGQDSVVWAIRYQGETIPLHTVTFTNTGVLSYMKTATLPIRLLIETAAPLAATSLLRIFCVAINSNGGTRTSPFYHFAVTRGVTFVSMPASPTEYPLIVLRLAPTFNSQINRIAYALSHYQVIAASNGVLSRLRWYPHATPPTLNVGATFAAVDTQSGIQACLNATSITIAGSSVIEKEFIPSGGGSVRSVGDIAISSFLTPFTLDAAGGADIRVSNAGGNSSYIALTGVQVGGAATASAILAWDEVQL